MEYLKESRLGIDCFSIAVGYGYDREESIAFRDYSLAVLQDNGYDIKELLFYQIGMHTGPYPLGFGIIERGIHSSQL